METITDEEVQKVEWQGPYREEDFPRESNLNLPETKKTLH
jgi:hypothetical protein